MTNYYHVLGLSENASQQEIKAAFKRLAVKYHPDKHAGDVAMEEKFKQINVAHQILSDEYEKARFDLKLKYQQFASQQPKGYSYRPTDTEYWKRRARDQYRPKHVDYKQNALATLYAFGITFIIALVVMSGVWMKQGYDDKQLQKLLAERRSTYLEAKDSFESGDYKNAFQLMTSLSYFRTEENEMKDFKDSMLEEMTLKGDAHFNANRYHEAINLYKMVLELDTTSLLYEVKQKLAKAYKATNQPEEALEIWKDFLVNEYEIIGSLVQIAEVHRTEFNDLDEALDHLLIAHKLAIKRYKKFYGKGYALVINEATVPKSHYKLYTSLADLYLQLEDIEMAIKASEWNKYVWPDSVAAYITTGHAFLASGDVASACKEFEGARSRKYKLDLPSVCK